MSDCPDYAGIKALAATLGRPAATLIALSQANDPFYLPPSRVRDAEWFAELWRAYAPDGRIHLRRLHYWLISLPAASRPTRPDGAPYENTHEDWQLLLRASLGARVLHLVDAGAFDDRRNGAPFIFTPTDEDTEAAIDVRGAELEELEPLSESSPFRPYSPTPDFFPELPAGYAVEAPEIAEPYAIELWCEKTTVNDILLPIAHRDDVSLVTGLGELSLTRVDQLVERVIRHRRKTRILYISDYDPSGIGMPVSIARKIELYLRRDGLDLDIRLQPLVLTREQVERYRLPRIPIKDSDQRKNGFEQRFGEGAVELDAIEALRPGELARIVSAAIAVYRQPAERVREEIAAAAADFQAHCDEVCRAVFDAHQEPLARLRAEFASMRAEIAEHQETLRGISAEIAEAYGERIDEATEAIGGLRQGFAARAEEVFSAINADLEDEEPNPDEVDWPIADDAEADEDDAALFDSRRSYLEQMDFYKNHQRKPTSGRAPRRINGGGAA